MVDLHGQYLRIKPEIDNAIQSVLESTAFVKGEEVKLFEKELGQYLGIDHVVACANGTDALQICLMALDLHPGDEVITPNFTFIATVEVAALLGLRPVLVDVDPDTFTMDMDSLRNAITPKTRVIIPVHLFGQCANMEAILQLAATHHITVIEDLAQALSSEFTFGSGKTLKAGTMGRMACTSFFPSKNLGCFGDGGAIVTHDKDLADSLAAICHHGMRTRYHYDVIGVNSRLDTMQAAILRIKLKHLEEYTRARQTAAAYYDKALGNLPGVKIPARASFSTHVFHQYTLKLLGIDREALKQHLAAKGIPSMIYYPKPLHVQKAFRYLGYADNDFPVTNSLCTTVLSLPMHTELDEEQLSFITRTLIEFVSLTL